MLDETRSGFYQDCFEKVNAISKSLIFLGLELCGLSDDAFCRALKSMKLRVSSLFCVI